MATPIPENSASFRLDEVAQAVGGRLVELDPELAVRGVSTDSRSTRAGSLFVALAGEKFDGHRFVDEVRQRGAVALVTRGRGINGPRIEVADSLIALGALARRFVERECAGRSVPILAIGGAAGKTTTKTLTAAAVGALFGPTLVTAGNLNNRIGVPMTLFTLAPAHRAIVLEHGTSEPGEIAALTEISQPDVGLVVNVGIEHSERLGGVDRIADEEATLLLAAGRYAVTNGDEPLLVERLSRARAHPLRFGVSAACDLRVVSRLVAESGTTDIVLAPQGPFFAVREPGGELRISTPLLGEHVALNVAAAVLAALALLDRRASASEIDAMKAAVAAVEAVPGRLQPRRIGELLVIDDSYNSNPRSLRAALATARELADRRGSRLVLALGDMLELGDLAATEHRALLQLAAESGAQEILLVGAESARALEGLPAPHHSLYRIFRTSTEAASRIDDVVQPGDVVLVKGSRGIQMERLIETLEKAR